MPLPLLLPLAALALSAAGTGYGIIDGKKKEKKAQADLEKAKAAEVPLTTPQAVKDQLADAQSKYGSVNPALTGVYQQALQGQQNAASFAQRNATSGAQALQAASNAQNQTQAILPQISQLQTNYDQANRGAYINALQNSAQDSRLIQSDAQERNQAAQQFALGQLTAAQQNKSQAIAAGLATVGSALNYAGQINQQSRVPTQSFIQNTNGNGTPLTSIAPVGYDAQYNTPSALTRVAMAPQVWGNNGLYYNPYRFRY